MSVHLQNRLRKDQRDKVLQLQSLAGARHVYFFPSHQAKKAMFIGFAAKLRPSSCSQSTAGTLKQPRTTSLIRRVGSHVQSSLEQN